MSETGVVKFTCEHHAVTLPMFAGFEELNACRRKLLQLRLIGADGNGIGFGNLSLRATEADAFYITGSGTGGLPRLGLEHFAKVMAYDFSRNWLRCEGGTLASSESLTHAAIYEADRAVGAVIHCHSCSVWERLVATGAATDAAVEYGTPEMANEVRRLFSSAGAEGRKLVAMAGHQDGVVAVGSSLEDALWVLLAQFGSVSS